MSLKEKWSPSKLEVEDCWDAVEITIGKTDQVAEIAMKKTDVREFTEGYQQGLLDCQEHLPWCRDDTSGMCGSRGSG